MDPQLARLKGKQFDATCFGRKNHATSHLIHFLFVYVFCVNFIFFMEPVKTQWVAQVVHGVGIIRL
jgi:hypothetical protein